MAEKKNTEPNETGFSRLTEVTKETHTEESKKEEEKGETEKQKGIHEGLSEPCTQPDLSVLGTSLNPELIENRFPVVTAPSTLSEAELRGLLGQHPPEQQQFHLWQNLDTGEYQYRPVRLDQPPSRIVSQPLGSPHLEYPPQQGLGPFPRQLQSPTTLIPPSHRTVSGGEQGKRPRKNWSGSLQKAFEKAVDELGPNATPNPIRDKLREEGFDDMTREQVSSHLQKYKFKQQNLKQKEHSGSLSVSKEEKEQEDQDSPTKSEEKTD